MSIAQNPTLQNLESEPIAASELKDISEPSYPTCPPTDIYSDEPPLETTLHLQQMILFLTCLDWLWRDRTDYFAAGNLTIYYNENQLKTRDYRGPDFFVVLGTEKKHRKSWVVWDEGGKYPNIIIEILSDSTAQVDRGTKKAIYQDIFRTPDYFWFDPDSLEFNGFHLVDGQYDALQPNEQGWLWSQQLELFLGVQDGFLRFFTPDGELVLKPAEENESLAEENESLAQKKEILTQEKESLVQENDRLAAKLREMGVDPEAIASS